MEMNKARIRLNQETIEYNVSVLTGRKDDNEDLKEHQNKKLRTLERKVREVATQVKNDLKTHYEKNKKLTNELQKLTKNFKYLQEKFKHFGTVDKNKYNAAWEMHEDEVREMLDKIYQADRTI
jgi:dynein regulatory complex protein 1